MSMSGEWPSRSATARSSPISRVHRTMCVAAVWRGPWDVTRDAGRLDEELECSVETSGLDRATGVGGNDEVVVIPLRLGRQSFLGLSLTVAGQYREGLVVPRHDSPRAADRVAPHRPPSHGEGPSRRWRRVSRSTPSQRGGTHARECHSRPTLPALTRASDARSSRSRARFCGTRSTPGSRQIAGSASGSPWEPRHSVRRRPSDLGAVNRCVRSGADRVNDPVADRQIWAV
jgi:hypothetical protein